MIADMGVAADTAVAGFKSARARREKALAERAELENAERSGQLVRMSEIEEVITQKIIVPLGSLLNSLPAALDTRCNPEHPDVARAALLDWVERTAKPTMRSSLA